MNFTDAVKICFQKYITFSGRAARPEYWFFFLFCFLASLLASMLDGALFGVVKTAPIGSIVTIITLLPGISVAVRRMHDLGKSGWWVLINFIPILGWIVFIVWASTKGTESENRFGA